MVVGNNSVKLCKEDFGSNNVQVGMTRDPKLLLLYPIFLGRWIYLRLSHLMTRRSKCELTIHGIAQVILGMLPFDVVCGCTSQHTLVKDIAPMVNFPQPMDDANR